MKAENLKMAAELYEKRVWILQQIEAIKEDTCIYIGTQTRLDKHMDIHTRMQFIMREQFEKELIEVDRLIEAL